MAKINNIAQNLIESFVTYAHRPAIEIKNQIFSYQDLHFEVSKLLYAIRQHVNIPKRIGILGEKNLYTYAGILACVCAGITFVPLNKKFPIARILEIANAAELDAIIIENASQPLIEQLAVSLKKKPVLILPDINWANKKIYALPIISKSQLKYGQLALPESKDSATEDNIAYILFTSGSTGLPKGVCISFRSLRYFLNINQEKYNITTEDRVSQTFDQTFDLFMFDLFMALCHGATIFVPQPIDLLSPTIFVNEKKLTVWFSVPSVINFARRKNVLAKKSMPSLRLSLFCGEPLTTEAAAAWQHAAPNSRVENLYGPTELTIACSNYPYDKNNIAEHRDGIVPIGKIYAGLQFKILDEKLQETSQEGELCVAGPQNFSGYLDDSEKTKEAQIKIDNKIYYRTGDIVNLSSNNNLIYRGRRDQQIKVNGHRIEPAEIEAALRKFPGIIDAAVIGWPVTDSTLGGLVAFITGEINNISAVEHFLRKKLPPYMIPNKLLCLEEMPLNPNGKINKKMLFENLMED